MTKKNIAVEGPFPWGFISDRVPSIFFIGRILPSYDHHHLIHNVQELGNICGSEKQNKGTESQNNVRFLAMDYKIN